MLHSLPHTVECKSCGNREITHKPPIGCTSCDGMMTTDAYRPFEDEN